MNPKLIAFLRMLAANFLVPALGAAAAARWNPLPSTSPFYSLVAPVAGALLTRLSLMVHPNGLSGPAAAKPVRPAVGLTIQVLGLCALFTVTGCAFLKGSSASGQVSGNGADVTVTIPGGSQIGITVGNGSACVQGPFINVPYLNLACDTSCGTLIAGGIEVTTTCKVQGTDGPTFPINFPLPVGEQTKAKAIMATRLPRSL